MSQFVDGKFQIKNTNVTLPLGNKLGIGITNSNSELDVHGTFQISKEYDDYLHYHLLLPVIRVEYYM